MTAAYPPGRGRQTSGGGARGEGVRAAAAAVSLSQMRLWGAPLWGRSRATVRTVQVPRDDILRRWGTTGGRLLVLGYGPIAVAVMRVARASMCRGILPRHGLAVIG